VPRYRATQKEERHEVGLATGLAWTEVGGEILPIEVTLMPGKGALRLTGKLGDVMQESAHAALSFVRSRAEQFGIPRDFSRKVDVHIHVPEGAIPKDGPSAGITICTALVSAVTRMAVRRDVAMTGEITLRGKVLPIGGVKEKLLAAHRIGVTTVILPRENEKDLADVPKNVLEAMEVQLVDHVDEVLKIALLPPEPPPVRVEPGETGDVLGTVPDGMTH
jgi:ATP-dependent Lon protease